MGAYLNAVMVGFVLMRFTGKMVNLMCEVNPEFAKYVVREGRTKALYVELNKALYSCVQLALLWYETFSRALQEFGFVVNLYHLCVANAMIDRNQCTIAWFVDNTKILHKDPGVASKVINKIEERYGKMTVTRGASHTFLRMDINFDQKGEVLIGMKQYILEAIKECKIDIWRHAATPAKRLV